MHTCRHCGLVAEADQFHFNKGAKVATRCLSCIRAYYRGKAAQYSAAQRSQRTQRFCYSCRHTKPVAEFGNNPLLSSRGHRVPCLACAARSEQQVAAAIRRKKRATIRSSAQADPVPFAWRTYRRAQEKRGKPFVTLAAYRTAYERPAQCEACGAELLQHRTSGFADKSRIRCIDHNHSTGAIRGTLCTFCNSALGYAKESRVVLHGLLAYLDKYEPVAAAHAAQGAPQ